MSKTMDIKQARVVITDKKQMAKMFVKRFMQKHGSFTQGQFKVYVRA